VSSRSHAVCLLRIQRKGSGPRKPPRPQLGERQLRGRLDERPAGPKGPLKGQREPKAGLLVLVDCAGSERKKDRRAPSHAVSRSFAVSRASYSFLAFSRGFQEPLQGAAAGERGDQCLARGPCPELRHGWVLFRRRCGCAQALCFEGLLPCPGLLAKGPAASSAPSCADLRAERAERAELRERNN